MKTKLIDPKDRNKIMEIAAQYLLEDLKNKGDPIESPEATTRFLQIKLSGQEFEGFYVMFLDTRHRVISFEKLFTGTIDGAVVYPRVVAKRALDVGAAAVIFAHNHPSGIPEPSLADQTITKKLKDALNLLDIRLLDHVVVGNGLSVSMAAKGMI